MGTTVPVVAGIALGSRQGDHWDGAAAVPIVAGFWFGPSLGHFYAHQPKRALIGIGIRTVALAGLGAGVLIEEGKNLSEPSANLLETVSIVVGLASMFYDIAEAPLSVRRHNEEILKGHATITPSLIGGARAPGLRLDWTF
jgi:hypothetical protein